MTAEFRDTDAFKDARFINADCSGLTLRDCDVTRFKITNSYLADVRLFGHLGNVSVNDVDVTAFVQAELDRRYPERVQLRGLQTAADFKNMWTLIEELWRDTTHRAQQLPEEFLDERVDEEWSFSETLRHLVFAIDAWLGCLVEPAVFHRVGLPHSELPESEALALGLDPEAHPLFGEVLEVRTDRVAAVRTVVDALTDDGLEEMSLRSPMPDFPDERRSVRQCLSTVMSEECAHLRYATRDLAVLEARNSASG
jgi:hypothetical protein